MRRTLIIAAIVLLLAVAGVAAYFFFMRSANVTVAPGGDTGLPVAGQGTPPSQEVTIIPPSSGTATSVSSRLVKVSEGPIVPGEIVINKGGSASSSSEVIAQYIERQSGNIFSYSTATKRSTRISNKTLPGIQSALWLPNGSFAFVRYLSGADFSTINTYALPSTGTNGFFLSQNLSGISLSSTNVLTLSSGVNGSVASLSRTDGSHTAEIFRTPLSSLIISFAGKNQYLAYTKPSSSLQGDAFLVDTTGHFSRIAGPLYGLTALTSPSGKWALISYTLGNTMQMRLVHTVTGESIPLPIATIAEKCVWTNDDSSLYCGVPVNPPSSRYPDDWYQGIVHFSDRIWRIDVTSRYAQLVLDFTAETKDVLDASSLALDPSGTTLVFLNKNDSSLWSYSF